LTGNLKLFAGKRILIVEDEYLVAQETRRMLEKCGAHVVGPVSNLADGTDYTRNGQVDAAILDIKLDEELVFPLADLLDSLAIPFVFATGHEASILPDRYKGYILCEKPAHLDAIAKALFAPENRDH
jgi:two-component SAPR family response regulator